MQFVLFVVLSLAVVGAYWVGLFHGERRTRSFGGEAGTQAGGLRPIGLCVAAALPLSWIVYYWAFILHVRLSLGRWPHFGETLPGSLLAFHQHTLQLWMLGMVWSLCLVALMAFGCLCWRKRRHITGYCLAYAVTVGLAFGALFVAPGPFLNWLFD
jgi:hypothetical protein